jgi:hypothetical protein
MQVCKHYRHSYIALWLCVLMVILLASEARSQTQQVTIIDGPGIGTVLNVTPVTPTAQDPFVVGTVNNGAGTIGVIEDHPGVGLHFHGTLNGAFDPNPNSFGWGHVVFGNGGPPSSVFNFVEQFGVAGNVIGFSPDGTLIGGGFTDGTIVIDPANPNNIWTFNADPTAPGGGAWTATPLDGGEPFNIDDQEFQEQLGGIGSVLIADNSANNGTPPAANPPVENPPAANPPATPATPTGPWTPAQGAPTQQQLNDEWQELKNMYDGYMKAKDYADKHPDNKLAQENAKGLLDELGQQANKVATMQVKFAISVSQSAAAANNTPQPTPK